MTLNRATVLYPNNNTLLLRLSSLRTNRPFCCVPSSLLFVQVPLICSFPEGQRQKHLPWLLILSWYWFYLLSTFGTLPLAQKISSWLLSAVMCKHAVKTLRASTSIQYFNSVVTLNDASTLKNTECRLGVHRVQCVHKNPKNQLYLIILNCNNTKLEKDTNINDNCGSLLSVYQ